MWTVGIKVFLDRRTRPEAPIASAIGRGDGVEAGNEIAKVKKGEGEGLLEERLGSRSCGSYD